MANALLMIVGSLGLSALVLYVAERLDPDRPPTDREEDSERALED